MPLSTQPIHMIIFIVFIIYSKRDFGSMLIAERKTRVYQRKDGGDGKGRASEFEEKAENQPKDDTPLRSWNMLLPVFLLIFFIFYLLVKSGEVEGEDQSIMDKIEVSDSYVALLWGTMAAAICTLLAYWLQTVKDGEFVLPTSGFAEIVSNMFNRESTDENIPKARSLMSVKDSIEAFLFGMGRICKLSNVKILTDTALILQFQFSSSGIDCIDLGVGLRCNHGCSRGRSSLLSNHHEWNRSEMASYSFVCYIALHGTGDR